MLAKSINRAEVAPANGLQSAGYRQSGPRRPGLPVRTQRVGRQLVFSLVYFIVLANTLSIADFGLFATASATGVVLPHPLLRLRVAALTESLTVRPALIGTYSARFIMMSVLSLPVLAVAALAMFQFVFAGQMALATFLMVVAAEALLWRPTEAVIIVNNGMGRFGRAAVLVITGTVLRAAAALVLLVSVSQTLADWALLYLIANAAALALAVVAFQPRQKLRLRPRLCLRHLRDSLSSALSDILFYIQMGLDKLMVLALGGAHLAGVYAIIMRLVDLTAVPIRTFSMMLVQAIMKRPEHVSGRSTRVLLEIGHLCCIDARHRAPGADASPLPAYSRCQTSPRRRRLYCWPSSFPACATWSSTTPNCSMRAARR